MGNLETTYSLMRKKPDSTIFKKITRKKTDFLSKNL